MVRKMRKFPVLSMVSAIAIFCATASLALAESPWQPAATTLPGSARAGSRDEPVKAGDATTVALQRMPAGTKVTVLQGANLLTPAPLTVGEDGKLSVPITIPEGLGAGLYPLTIVTENPASVSQVMLKLSDIVPAKNSEAFKLATTPVGERAYQSAISANDKLFVASARGPKDGSKLLRLDAATMAVEAEAELALDAKGKQIGVFGLAVDNGHGKVWTSNTLSDTVTVYNADDLKLAKTFPEGSVAHPRDIVIDEANNRAYVSAALSPFVEVYDTETLAHLGQLQFVADGGKSVFGTTDLALDAKAGKLYSISRDTPYIGWIDLATGKSTTVKLPQLQGATDIARDPVSGRLFVVSQESNNLVVLDAEGKLLADTYIGAGGVSVVWDAQSAQVFAATRAGGTVAVLDGNGTLVANIPVDDTPNHLTVGADGTVYLVSMYGGRGDDSMAGSITKITPNK
jgi:DNA-binding beta-propeller fold protein YncE